MSEMLEKSITPIQIANRLPGDFAKRVKGSGSALSTVSYLKQCFVNAEFENFELKQKIAELEAEIETLRTAQNPSQQLETEK